MKKLSLVFLFLLCSCGLYLTPERNEKCMAFEEYYVVNVLYEYAFARACTKDDKRRFSDGQCLGPTVLLRPQIGVDYYDGMVIHPPKNKCSVQNGVYKYTTVQDISKTIPIIEFGYEYPPQTRKEAELRREEVKAKITKMCTIAFKKEGKEPSSVYQQRCHCLSNLTFNKDFLGLDNDEWEKAISFRAKKQCGEFPKDFID